LLLAGDARRAESAFSAPQSDGPGMAGEIGRVEALVLVGRLSEASELCRTLLESGEPTVTLLVACGEASARGGDAFEGYGLYRRGVARTSDRPGLVERMEALRVEARDKLAAEAREAAVDEDWDQARADIGRALTLDPESAALLAAAGDVESKAGESEKAIHLYREALHLDPKSIDVQEKIANLALETGDLGTAVSMFDALSQSDARFLPKAEEARLAFRVANWPDLERAAARSARLTRAGAATLVWWMYPEVRDAQVAGGVIASDVLARRDSRALTRALALGFLEADQETHRANPDSAMGVGAAARLLLRLLAFVVPSSRNLPCPARSRRVLRSASESLQTAQACGLLPGVIGPTLSGAVFTRSLDRVRALAGGRAS
jgi:Tfp pilus assembly protein PilF